MIRYLRDKIWFFAALALGVVVATLPAPQGLGPDGLTVLAMTAAATVLFVTEPVPLPTVALLIVVGQVLFLNIPSTVVAKSLMTDSVLFIMGSLMLAVALVKQNLDKRLALAIVSFTGSKVTRIALGISIVSGLLAAFIGEHTVAAMMLPVAMTLVSLAEKQGKGGRNLAVLLLFSISYACAVAGIATPSGGARNAIMIGYWKDFFVDPADPDTARYSIDYLDWMVYAFPVFLVQLPILHLILRFSIKPESRDLAEAVDQLKEQVGREGRMRGRHYAAIAIFLLVLVGWITLSGSLGMGTIALLGASLFLIGGLVRWNDVNTGVNWGVVLLYAAAISLGVRMQETGAAAWLADTFLGVLSPLGLGGGLGLLFAVMLLTFGVTNVMSNGAAVAVLGPVVLGMAGPGDGPLALGFATALASSFAYLTVIGTPASTIVHSAGYLKSSDFMAVGWKLTLASFAVLMAFAAFYWPLLGKG